MSYPFSLKPIPLAQKSNNLGKPKRIPQSLQSVLANLNSDDDNADNPYDGDKIKPGKNKIYLGQAASYPETTTRYPFWLPVDLLSTHLFIGGAIGSGKTTVLLRLISGALKWYGTVIVCEAKGGINGGKEGAAFTDLADYLQQKFPDIICYRWPRGNCCFNPLRYLNNPQDRREFFAMIAQVIVEHYQLDGETVAVVYNAATIAEYLLIYLQNFESEKIPTLRKLVHLLYFPDKVKEKLKKAKENITKQENSLKSKYLQILEDIEQQLNMANFFYLNQPQLTLTRRGVQLFKDMLNHEDLLDYTEPHPDLKMLDLDDILYHRALVILSQPLSKSSSNIVGPLFLDNLLTRILELGPNPQPKDDKPREKILAILDETHRLPVGTLGLAGDYLREFNVGLVEVAPTIPDNQKRWEQNKHVYQTLLSLSPGIPTLTSLMRDRLPNLPISPTIQRYSPNASGITKVRLEKREDYELSLGEDNPGVANRSLQMSGRFTGLLQSPQLQEERKLFWIDFEDELLANIKTLLKDALAPDATSQTRNLVDYVLGLDEYKP
jgi:hypothetical protein